MGFDAVLLPSLWNDEQAGSAWSGQTSMQDVLEHRVRVCDDNGLDVFMDVAMGPSGGARLPQENDHVSADGLQQWITRLQQCVQAGVAGFRCLGLAVIPTQDWRQLIQGVRTAELSFDPEQPLFLGWTPGLTPEQLDDLSGVGFDGVFSSFPWWDWRASWLVQEDRRLTAIAPVIAPVVDLNASLLASSPSGTEPSPEELLRCVQTAAFTAGRIAVPLELARGVGSHAMLALNTDMVPPPARDAPLRMLSGPLAAVTALFRYDPHSAHGGVFMINPDTRIEAIMDVHTIRGRLPGNCRLALPAGHDLPGLLPPSGTFLLPVEAVPDATPQGQAANANADCLDTALQSGRIVIERVSPSVNGGRFPIKRISGQPVRVEADVYMDGHDVIAAEVLWRAASETEWRSLPMQHMDNDRWQAMFHAGQPGRYCYTVRAWRDGWQTHQDAMRKKQAAGQDISLDQQEAATGAAEGERSFETLADTVFPLLVERREAQFANWYELFPRSQSGVAGQHGTFRDVEQRLPAIRDMGFDVLYFPPIHPIGQRNRKGRNNALQAGPDDPGSPYAIGSAQGGHDTVHPELGTLEDFERLLHRARDHGMEIALDFAIQCSPDHPWLEQHPEWFDWRADGSLRYAENPPKRYEDIVNPDFYSPNATNQQRAGLWRALRDTVLFWADHGVRTFRVDNPHTKPLPFWEWLLYEVRQRYPDTLFLSEAFTRPKMMYRLAKAGFSQSYTYFTWRNHKQELTDYLTELNTPPVADFFRPNFFVNTPDINPYFLQQSGRAGFLIRAGLACTLSGLWGVYSGFELCESRPLPGREEYADSEKYQLRQWDLNRPGNIIAEITRLNQIRYENPALQSHLGLRFHTADNDQILFFSKSTANCDSVVLVAISLNPHATEGATLHFPFWLFGLPDDGQLPLRELYDDTVFTLNGKDTYIHLTPERPFALWRLETVGNPQDSYGENHE